MTRLPSAYVSGATMASISLRVRFLDETAIGPGKVRLLELIGETGSISAAGRSMAMSYHRAWNLVEELNGIFAEPLVEKQPGGRKGGGATLTRAGTGVIRRYRAIERGATRTAAVHLAALEQMAAKPRASCRRSTRRRASRSGAARARPNRRRVRAARRRRARRNAGRDRRRPARCGS